MKQQATFRLFWALSILFVLVSSCKRNQEITPSADFAPYISAYTGGMIDANSTIRVELTQEMQVADIDAEVKESYFSFNPSIKGKTYWVNSRTVEFVPDSNALRPGTLYNASFDVGKLINVDKRLKKFEFSFRLGERNFTLNIDYPEVSASSPEKMNVHGTLRFSEPPTLLQVKEMVRANHAGEKCALTVEPTEDQRKFRFVVQDVEKKSSESRLIITANGTLMGVNRSVEGVVDVPAKGVFELLTTEVIHTPEYGCRLIFSNPVSEMQELKGLISINSVASFTSAVVGNRVELYFDRVKGGKEVVLSVFKGLKSLDGNSLPKNYSLTLEKEFIKPQVELLSSGTVMPVANELILPFRAVNLYAVDVSVIRIFENNVLMFLQENSLSQQNDSYGLRRAGRLVYKKMIRLDGDLTQELSEWNNYSLDLKNLVAVEPGAIYRVELSFKQAYASYPCENEASARLLEQSNTLVSLGESELTERDEEVWDTPTVGYYDYYYYGDDYDWDEQDNPCHSSYYVGSNRRVFTNLLSTNIGIIAKGNSTNDYWVTVTNLQDAKPMANVEVTLYNFQLQAIGTVRTDGDGFAFINSKAKPFILVAAADNQKGYLRLVDGEENMLSRFDVGGVVLDKGLKGFVYGERGVWRPGDTLHLSFMLMDREGRIPANHPVSIELYNPRGQFYSKQISVEGVNGHYSFSLPTAQSDPTGIWNAYVKVGGASFHKSLRVETVKPNRLKINLDVPGNMLLSIKKSVPLKIKSSWLTGAVARQLKTKMEMTLTRGKTAFKGYESYLFDNPAADFSSISINAYEGALNDVGEAAFDLKLPEAKVAPGILTANLVCRVFEPGGDASIYHQAIPFSPFSAYVGIDFKQKKPSDWFVTDEDLIFDVVTLNAEGQPVERDDLEYKVYRIGWSWWWQNDNDKLSSYLNSQSIKPIEQGRLSTKRGKGQVKFRVNYPDWGRYFVFVKDREGCHATGGIIYVDWPDWRGRSNKSDPDNLKMLSFSLDKSSYNVGDKATVIIPAAAEGRALVTIENGTEVLKREWINVSPSGDTKYTIKVTDQMAPNVFVHISLLQPHGQALNDLPIRMYGVMPLLVEDKSSHLSPEISMKDLLRPEEPFEVKVKEKGGKAMTYTLAIVDDGLLDLTNFKTPNPWDAFYAREALGIRTWDMFDYVIGAYAGKYSSMFSIGGDEGGKPVSSKANRFKPVVKFIGPFALKRGETKTHQLQLDAYVGSVRVMVVAGEAGAYGSAEKTVPVRSPLMVLSSLPRVLSVNEEIALPVNLFVLEEGVKEVQVKVETTGLIKLSEGSTQKVTFNKIGDKMVYFPMKTAQATGIERVTITATGNGHTSKETIEIDVRNPNPPVIRMETKLLKAGETAELAYNLDEGYDDNNVLLEISRIPTVDVTRRFDFLYDYPHYCTEQLTSRALPLLFISQFKELDNREVEMVKKNVREAISQLYSRQTANGGFVMWPGTHQEDDWVTSYAGTFLLMAKEKGYDVNQSVINRWIARQRRLAQNWTNNSPDNRRYKYNQTELLQAYRLYTLALAGAPELGAMNRMKSLKECMMQARWRLAAAYALAGRTNAADELLFKATTEVDEYSSNNSSFGSSLRDEAMILETLVLMKKEQESFNCARRVSAKLTKERAFSTQSTAYALMAMGRLAESMSGELKCDWSQNGGSVEKVSSSRSVYIKELPIKPSTGTVQVKSHSSGVLYVQLVSKTKPLVDETPVIADNLRLGVVYTDMGGRALDVATLPQGTDFLAEVKVFNISGVDNYKDLALTQMIPSGWEIFNERMVIEGAEEAKRSSYIYRDIRDDAVLTYFDLPAGQAATFKVRLQASYAGSFVFPAIQCEAMYDPRVQARTRASRVQVVRSSSSAQ